MGKYILRRLLLIIPVFIGVTLLTFILSHLIPGDPFVSDKISAEVREQIKHSYGLDKPLYEQYVTYVVNFVRGDWGPSFARQGSASVTDIIFGTSASNDGPPLWLRLVAIAAGVAAVVALLTYVRSVQRGVNWANHYLRRVIGLAIAAPIIYTLFLLFTGDMSHAGGFIFSARLGLMAFGFMLIVGIPLGILAAFKQNTWIDYTVSTLALIAYSIPSFVLGLLALVVVVFLNAVFKASFPVAPTSPQLADLILPAALLGAREAAIIARLTRSSMLEVLQQDYLRTAQAKGLGVRLVLIRHALKNALIPVVTVLGDEMSGLLTGSVTIERVFNIPGIGYYFVSSILSYDYPMILGTVVLYAMLVVFINLAVDLLYGVLDPRISYTTQRAG